MNALLVDHQNIYEQMASSPMERERIISLSIRSPTEYKLILIKDLIQDAERVVECYINTIGQSDETAKRLEDDRLAEAHRLGLAEAFSEPATSFNSRLIELVSQISPLTLSKMAKAYKRVHFTVSLNHQNPRAIWKTHLWVKLQSVGESLKENFPNECSAISRSMTSEQMAANLVHGAIIPFLQSNPLPDEGQNLVMLQNDRLNYVGHLLITASLQLFILSD